MQPMTWYTCLIDLTSISDLTTQIGNRHALKHCLTASRPNCNLDALAAYHLADTVVWKSAFEKLLDLPGA